MIQILEMSDSLIVPPTLEPLDLDEVKKQRKVTSTSLDTLFDLWISAARQHFEEETGRQLLEATWEAWLGAFPSGSAIELPHPPLQRVVSVVYDDESGTEQTVDASNYRVIAPSGDYAGRGRIELVTGASWPTAGTGSNAVRVRFIAGYGPTSGSVPELVKVALYFLVGHFHRFSEEVQAGTTIAQLPIGAPAILRAWKFTALPTIRMTTSIWAA